jgi:FHA domain-containing protein
MLVRFRIECRGRIELREVSKRDVEIGRDPDCDLSIEHATIAPRHARILVRRGRLILADLGRAKMGTTRRRQRVTAPIALDPGEMFRLGDVSISATLATDLDRSFVGREIGEGRLVSEIESPDRGARRYRIALRDRGEGEVAVLDREFSDGASEPWLARARGSDRRSPHLPRLLGCSALEGRPYLVEETPKGIRLSSLLEGVGRGTVQLPIEATVAAIALIAESVAEMNAAWGPHGAIDPRRVQLGLDGSALLLRPGPFIGDLGATPDEYVAPERRVAVEPTTAGDAFSLGVLGKSILHRRPDCPMKIRAICYWLAHANPSRRPSDLKEVAREFQRAAQSAGLDPTFGHVARVARLLAPNLSRPFCTVPRAVADEEPWEWPVDREILV